MPTGAAPARSWRRPSTRSRTTPPARCWSPSSTPTAIRPRQSGVLMCLTLGGCGIWYLYDVVVLAAGDFSDGDGRRVVRWEVGEAESGAPQSLRRVEELDGRMQMLESQVNELAERLDFAERLLAQARERGSLPKG